MTASPPFAAARRRQVLICQERNSDGTQCKQFALKGTLHCRWHDPRVEPAGRKPKRRFQDWVEPTDFSTMEAVKDTLRRAADAVREGRLKPDQAKALGVLAREARFCLCDERRWAEAEARRIALAAQRAAGLEPVEEVEEEPEPEEPEGFAMDLGDDDEDEVVEERDD